MESSRTKIAGPAIAAGAVSIGLVLIGACGVGKHDTYVPPPPLKAGQHAEPVVREDNTGPTTPRVVIPPSPTWRVAPYNQSRPSPFAGFVTSTSADPSAPADDPAHAAPPEDARPSAARTTTELSEEPTATPRRTTSARDEDE
ncbi:hypothetical protein OHA40_21975 [Nocardia sp. NBC_00508]|uniref:hypothetical protein n=1 Tax=Nocardia sp. NBC_00508 TaxID=2975992 RepID=UPI002E81756A|nr:hypothetical protein [Nocardia sp. NBC_00508]WUD64361.1 hypothetical protein OHA40_21975 [Nocardia sp. NBC_00508]